MKPLALLAFVAVVLLPTVASALMPNTPAWTGQIDISNAQFGYAVGTAGDVNGDGYSDVIVGAPNVGGGRAYVYLGTATGLAATPAWTILGDQVNTGLGWSVGTAGDVNGDGYSDVIVGSIFYSGAKPFAGRAWVYLGSASGLSTSAAWFADGDSAGAAFGVAVGTAGDVNGDGYADVIVGSSGSDHGELNEGRAFVFLGSSTGLAAAPAWSADGNQPSARFGVAVGSAGDVNSDGYGDVIVGADLYDDPDADEGRAVVFLGSAAGLSATPTWTGNGDQGAAHYGVSVGMAGDVNGDGYGDVVVGADGFDNGQAEEGRAYVYLGSATGIAATTPWTVEANQGSAYLGHAVGTAGDVNGDGYADVLVGAWRYDNPDIDEGQVFVYLGSATGPAATAAWSAGTHQTNATIGSAGTAGDVNGDGFSDIIAGSPVYDDPEGGEGAAFVFHGGGQPPAVAAPWSVFAAANGRFGWSTASAGDVNGDGYSDVIAGGWALTNGENAEGMAFLYHGSASGLSTTPAWTGEGNQANAFYGTYVASAGDVNGDGYDDVIVGADFYDNNESNEGRVYVYHGSPTGLSATASWMAESNVVGAIFGYSCATAGDVNGDGYADVIIGAHLYTNGQSGEGAAYVYLGGAAGLAATPAWMIEGESPNAELGRSVGTAGDVNSDGYSDVIVGAHGYTNGEASEGRAAVYMGSASGLSLTPAWSVEGGITGIFLGRAVGTAGDVNGDGYSDVIVGAPQYANGQAAEGKAFVWLGSSSGLSPTPAWSLEMNVADSRLGMSVGTAGDVDGNGCSDVVIGAPYLSTMTPGIAYVVMGSPNGLGPAPAWTASPFEDYSHFGYAVRSAGDVNGDGFADVLIGAYGNDIGQPATPGRVYCYLGDAGDGRERMPRMLRSDGSAPIALLSRSDSPTSFRLSTLGRTAAGRGRVRLQYEVKPFGTAFDGLGTWTGPPLDTGAPVGGASAVAMTQNATGLQPDTRYRWRMRVLGSSLHFPRSPWFSPVANAVNELDLLTLAQNTGVDDRPGAFDLSPSRPNPFAGVTRFAYTLPGRGPVHVAIHSVTGQEVAVLLDTVQDGGRHEQAWDGRDRSGAKAAPGVYFARLRFAGRNEARRIVLAR